MPIIKAPNFFLAVSLEPKMHISVFRAFVSRETHGQSEVALRIYFPLIKFDLM